MAALKNDNSVNYGSRTITTITGAVTYVCDDFTVNRPVNEILLTDELNEPSGSVTYADFVRGTANLQFLTKYPLGGDTFSVTIGAEYGAETFIIQEVGNPEQKGSIKMVPITFLKSYA